MALQQFKDSIEECLREDSNVFENWERAAKMMEIIKAKPVTEAIKMRRMKAEKELSAEFKRKEALMGPYTLPVDITYCMDDHIFTRQTAVWQGKVRTMSSMKCGF
jgi:hypothetical protein